MGDHAAIVGTLAGTALGATASYITQWRTTKSRRGTRAHRGATNVLRQVRGLQPSSSEGLVDHDPSCATVLPNGSTCCTPAPSRPDASPSDDKLLSIVGQYCVTGVRDDTKIEAVALTSEPAFTEATGSHVW
jgi:hypothetical protein